MNGGEAIISVAQLLCSKEFALVKQIKETPHSSGIEAFSRASLSILLAVLLACPG
jgi:hypothetical protein